MPVGRCCNENNSVQKKDRFPCFICGYDIRIYFAGISVSRISAFRVHGMARYHCRHLDSAGNPHHCTVDKAAKNREIIPQKGENMMDYVCMFLGILFTTGGIFFAFGEIHKHLSAWQKMPDEEKSRIKIKPLCRNIGGMIALNGIIFILKGCCAGFSDRIFQAAIILWLVIAGLDVCCISKSSRYINQ